MFDIDAMAKTIEAPEPVENPREALLRAMEGNGRWKFYPVSGETDAWEASGCAVYLGHAVARIVLDGDIVRFSLDAGLKAPSDRRIEMRKYMMSANAIMVMRGFALEDGCVVFRTKQHISEFDLDDVLPRAASTVRSHMNALCAVVAGAAGSIVFAQYLKKNAW